MFALTKKTDYALIALAELARRFGAVVSAREIADRYNVPLPLLTNILKGLTRASIVHSERGAYGGYRLARPADTINLHELISAIEGPFQFVRCAPVAPRGGRANCDLEPRCPIRLPAHRIRDRLARLLEEVTLAELVAGDLQPELVHGMGSNSVGAEMVVLQRAGG
jgi:Rrf2 family protein